VVEVGGDGSPALGVLNKLHAPDAQADDIFGYSVAISGDYIIVGTLGEDEGGNDAGAAYMY
jgi:hypothetical protein